MPRPLSITVTELSMWMVTFDLVAVAGQRLVNGVVDDFVDQVVQPVSVVEPIYIAGRSRTASRPSSTLMLLES